MRFSWKIQVQRLLALLVCLTLGACATDSAHRSSGVSYLYPNQNEHVSIPAGSTLPDVARVGVAFVPEQGVNREALAERDRQGLKVAVAAYLEQQPFVSEVTLIPSVYLRPGGSFGNLDQLRRMYDIDVMVMLSYDRTQFVEQGAGSVRYRTLDGEQRLDGRWNDTSTLLQAAVYEIDERQMLFLATGASHVPYTPAGISLSEQLRADSVAGFEQASAELLQHLRVQVDSLNTHRPHLARKADTAREVVEP